MATAASGTHDHGEFALRYVSPGLARVYAGKFGDKYRDFAKYLIYFTHGQEDFASDLDAKAGIMHVFGPTPEAIRELLERVRPSQVWIAASTMPM